MRGGGFHDPSRNRNAYPMTDGQRNPSAVTVRSRRRAQSRNTGSRASPRAWRTRPDRPPRRPLDRFRRLRLASVLHSRV